MARVNDHYLKLAAGYLFPEIGRRVEAFRAAHPDADLIRLGIGDVVLPLPGSVREAMHRAVDEMGTEEGFRGYAPDQGYPFLQQAIARVEYGSLGVEIAPDEIFISDGSKCDSANIQEIFSPEARIAVPDPTYPVYVDSNVMAGRTGDADDAGRWLKAAIAERAPLWTYYVFAGGTTWGSMGSPDGRAARIAACVSKTRKNVSQLC